MRDNPMLDRVIGGLVLWVPLVVILGLIAAGKWLMKQF